MIESVASIASIIWGLWYAPVLCNASVELFHMCFNWNFFFNYAVSSCIQNKSIRQSFDGASVKLEQSNSLQLKIKEHHKRYSFTVCLIILIWCCNKAAILLIPKCRIFIFKPKWFVFFSPHSTKRTHGADTMVWKRIPLLLIEDGH